MWPEAIDVQTIKGELQTSGAGGVAVDLDDTSCETVEAQIKRLIAVFGCPEDLTPFQLARKYGYVQHIPFWPADEVTRLTRDYMHENEFQDGLQIVSEAETYLAKINKIRGVKAYMTGRPDSVRPGTLSWLKRHKLPPGYLLMKPANIPIVDWGGDWKATELQLLYPEIDCIVDDNALLAKHLPYDYPGQLFLYGASSYRGDREFVVPCPTWKDVYNEVVKKYAV